MYAKNRCLFLVGILLCVALGVSCGPSFVQFYPDTYYEQDRIYQNETLGFALMFTPGWEITTDPSEMNKTRQAAARQLQEQGAELIFAGETVDGSQGTRGIVENLNRDNERFLAALRETNKANLDKDIGARTFMAGDVLGIKWEYEFQNMRFAEFLFRAGTYNVRIAFWTKADRYDDFLQVYEDIMATLDFRAGI